MRRLLLRVRPSADAGAPGATGNVREQHWEFHVHARQRRGGLPVRNAGGALRGSVVRDRDEKRTWQCSSASLPARRVFVREFAPIQRRTRSDRKMLIVMHGSGLRASLIGTRQVRTLLVSKDGRTRRCSERRGNRAGDRKWDLRSSWRFFLSPCQRGASIASFSTASGWCSWRQLSARSIRSAASRRLGLPRSVCLKSGALSSCGNPRQGMKPSSGLQERVAVAVERR